MYPVQRHYRYNQGCQYVELEANAGALVSNVLYRGSHVTTNYGAVGGIGSNSLALVIITPSWYIMRCLLSTELVCTVLTIVYGLAWVPAEIPPIDPRKVHHPNPHRQS